jgi:hypothetical protein
MYPLHIIYCRVNYPTVSMAANYGYQFAICRKNQMFIEHSFNECFGVHSPADGPGNSPVNGRKSLRINYFNYGNGSLAVVRHSFFFSHSRSETIMPLQLYPVIYKTRDRIKKMNGAAKEECQSTRIQLTLHIVLWLSVDSLVSCLIRHSLLFLSGLLYI